MFMLNILSKFFDSNDREVKKLLPIVDEINALESRVKKLKDSDFPKKTEDLKKRVEKGESIFLILPEAFALAREAAVRTTGLRPYDVQLVAATVLSQGKVAEQKTGEGKTLSAVPALYLNALSGNTVHLVTVNDYLARRDAGWMGVIFDFLGMKIKLNPVRRKDFPRPAPIPPHSILLNTKFPHLRDWKDALHDFLSTYAQ